MGIRKSNKKADPIFWFPPKIKNPEPKVRHMIAPTKRMDAIGSGISFEDIYSIVFPKTIIFRDGWYGNFCQKIKKGLNTLTF